jgi:hypothetical protein
MFIAVMFWDDFSDAIMIDVFGIGYYIVYTTREFHNPKRMLETLVSRARVDQECGGELMDVAQTLEGPRV